MLQASWPIKPSPRALGPRSPRLARSLLVAAAAALSAYASPAVSKAAEPAAPSAPPPRENACRKILEACQAAGFTKDGAGEGKGVWVHCVNPIAEGRKSEGAKLPLPSVERSTIEACKEQHDIRDKRPLKPGLHHAFPAESSGEAQGKPSAGGTQGKPPAEGK